MLGATADWLSLKRLFISSTFFYKILNLFKYSRRAGRDGGFDSDCLWRGAHRLACGDKKTKTLAQVHPKCSCFPSTKVLALVDCVDCVERPHFFSKFTCFSGALLVLYWYKRTNTDATRVRKLPITSIFFSSLLALLVLYWYKSTNTDATRACAACLYPHFLSSLLALLVLY